jgi:hypothetical protein
VSVNFDDVPRGLVDDEASTERFEAEDDQSCMEKVKRLR